jgi:chitodextrinase
MKNLKGFRGRSSRMNAHENPSRLSMSQSFSAIEEVLDCRNLATAPIIQMAPDPRLVAGNAVWLTCTGTGMDQGESTLQLLSAFILGATEQCQGLQQELSLDYLQNLKHESELTVTLSISGEGGSSVIDQMTIQVLTSPGAGMALPYQPGALKVTDASETGIQIAWLNNLPGQPTGNRVKWGLELSEHTTIGVKDLPLAQSRVWIEGLVPETKYYFFVYHTNAEGESIPATISWTTHAATSPPDSPTNLNAVPTKSTMALTWSGPANATGYKIDYGVAPSGAATPTTSLTPVCTISGLVSNTNYYFDVRSSNSKGDSSPTRIIKQTLQVPEAPAGLCATPAVTTMDLTWSRPSGTIEHYIRYGVEPNGAIQTLKTPDIRHTLEGLTKNTLYFVEVTAANYNGESLPARITQKTQDGPAIPSTPGSVRADVTYDTVRLVWVASAQKASYEITYGLLDKYPEIIGRQTTEYLTDVIRYLAPDTRYFIEVRAFNVSGHSSPSQTQALIGPDMTQPRGLRNPGATFCEALLTWEAPVDVSYLTGYEITSPGLASAQTTALQHVATGLVPEKDYVFKIQPLRQAGPAPALTASMNVVTHDRVRPTRPQALKVTPSTPGTATLSWRAAEDNVGVIGYEVRRNAGSWAAVSGTSLVVTDLIEGIRDTFEVRATDAAGNRSLVAVVKAGVSASEPLDLRITANWNRTVAIAWDAPIGHIPLGYSVRILGETTDIQQTSHTVFNMIVGLPVQIWVQTRLSVGDVSEWVHIWVTPKV